MIILITDASHTGKTALAQRQGVNYVLSDHAYGVDLE